MSLVKETEISLPVESAEGERGRSRADDTVRLEQRDSAIPKKTLYTHVLIKLYKKTESESLYNTFEDGNPNTSVQVEHEKKRGRVIQHIRTGKGNVWALEVLTHKHLLIPHSASLSSTKRMGPYQGLLLTVQYRLHHHLDGRLQEHYTASVL